MTVPVPFFPVGLSATGIACRRGERQLFVALDFTVAPGEALLLRGPNGAGKTSLLKIVGGLLRPDGGRIDLVGADPELRPQSLMHWLGHRPAVKPRLGVAENLATWMRCFGAAGDPGPALQRVGLGALGDLATAHLSAGQTRRLALALLLAAPRPIWLLDEPTAALDAAGDRLAGALIDAHLAAGGCAVVATHLPLAVASPMRELRLGAP